MKPAKLHAKSSDTTAPVITMAATAKLVSRLNETLMNLKGKYENETDCFGDKFSGNSGFLHRKEDYAKCCRQ